MPKKLYQFCYLKFINHHIVILSIYLVFTIESLKSNHLKGLKFSYLLLIRLENNQELIY